MAANSFLSNFKRSISDNKKGLIAVVTTAAVTAILVSANSGLAIVPNLPIPGLTPGGSSGVRLSTSLSQTKFVQGGSGQTTIEVDIDSPAAQAAADRKPTDFVVVLDRSGSMSADNRLPYAKSAIHELINRLQEGDRLGLVTFDQSAEVAIPLSPVTEAFKSSAGRTVDQISLGGSTNISEALAEANRQIAAVEPGRVRKILLLSDGEANVGTIDPDGLGKLAHEISDHSVVLSTIGMGLGFNERTMSLIADRGMGNYGYLENLEKLGTILARDIDSTRAVYAQASRVDLFVPAGASIVDAGGYPFSAIAGASNGYRIESGQLAGAARKSFFVTIQVSTGSAAEWNFAPAKLSYDIDGKTSEISAVTPLMVAAVVPPERQNELASSINQEQYRRSWALNNLGLMKSKVAEYVSQGRQEEADKAIADYRGQVAQAEKASNMQLMDAPTASAIAQIDAEAKDAFKGGAGEQSLKRNRYGKKYHEEGRVAQRSN